MRVYAYYSPEDIQRVFIAAIGVPPETVEISDAGAAVKNEKEESTHDRQTHIRL